jgi:hypothetical protein
MKNITINIRICKKILLLIVLWTSAFTNNGISQKAGLTVGIAAGPENALGIPKIGTFYKYYDSKDVKLYAGGEFNLWILFAAWYSTQLYHTIEYKNIGFKTSFSYFEYTKIETDLGDFGPFKHLTFTPKLHLKLMKNLEFQVGPSIFLWKRYSEPIDDFGLLTFTRSGQIHMNYELNFRLSFKDIFDFSIPRINRM